MQPVCLRSLPSCMRIGTVQAAEKINITLYIESYCPFCKKFVKKDLKKLMDSDLKDMVDVHLEPGVFAQKTKNKKGKMKWSCLHGETVLDRSFSIVRLMRCRT